MKRQMKLTGKSIKTTIEDLGVKHFSYFFRLQKEMQVLKIMPTLSLAISEIMYLFSEILFNVAIHNSSLIGRDN